MTMDQLGDDLKTELEDMKPGEIRQLPPEVVAELQKFLAEKYAAEDERASWEGGHPTPRKRQWPDTETA